MKNKSINRNLAEFRACYVDEIINNQCPFKDINKIEMFKNLTIKIADAYLKEDNDLNKCINFVNLYLEFQDVSTEDINNSVFYLLFNVNQKEEIITTKHIMK